MFENFPKSTDLPASPCLGLSESARVRDGLFSVVAILFKTVGVFIVPHYRLTNDDVSAVNLYSLYGYIYGMITRS